MNDLNLDFSVDAMYAPTTAPAKKKQTYFDLNSYIVEKAEEKASRCDGFGYTSSRTDRDGLVALAFYIEPVASKARLSSLKNRSIVRLINEALGFDAVKMNRYHNVSFTAAFKARQLKSSGQLPVAA
ncbi:MAG: hypothetical protein GY757_09915 [bacterium]|nr:hypothetical protein [bacterium]